MHGEIHPSLAPPPADELFKLYISGGEIRGELIAVNMGNLPELYPPSVVAGEQLGRRACPASSSK